MAAQLGPVGDKSFEFLCGEISERRRGRLENRVFLTQFFELIYSYLAVLRGFKETFGCMLHFEGRIIREPGANDNGKMLHPKADQTDNIKFSEHSQQSVEGE